MSSPSPSWTADEIVAHLRSIGAEENLAGMARYGIKTEAALGVGNAVLRPLARQVEKDHERALALWATGIREARLMALFTDEKNKVTRAQAERYAAEFNSWEMVDHAADLFCEAGLATELVPVFAEDEREFVRRAGFAMMAWGAVHLKKEPDATFLSWLQLIERHAGDARNFVRKAVNWALRQIGKRSPELHQPALQLAERLAASADKTGRWIGKDAVKELSDPKTLARLAKET